MRNRVIRRAAIGAVVLLLAVAAVAYADVINADGDRLAPSAQTMIDLGTVAPGATKQYDVWFLLECRNTTHVERGSTITLNPQNPSPAPGGSISATSATLGPVPATWPLPGETCVNDPRFQSTTASVVTIVAPTVVDTGYIYRIEYAKSPSTGLSGITTMTFRLSVGGNAAPVVTVPANITAEGDTLGGWASSYAATATDLEDGALAAPCVPASGTVLPVGTTIVSCTATDSAGASDTRSFSVTVTDTTPPHLVGVPGDLALETEDPTGTAFGWPAPEAFDIVDGALGVTCAPASGDWFPVGSTTVTCAASDRTGNSSSASFLVDVAFVDRTPPTISGLTGDLSVETEDPAGALVTWSDPTATDAVDGLVAVACAPASGSHFPVGSSTVVCTAADAAGNAAQASFAVTVTFVDRTAPVLDLPVDRSVATEDPAGATVSWPAPTAVDAVDGPVAVTCSPASGSFFPVGSTDVACSATDAAGNTASGSFRVTVSFVDATAPVLSGVPGDVVVDTTNAAGTAVSWTAPTAVDAIDGSVPVTCSPASGSTFPVGVTTVGCSASDAAGNTARASFTVTVNLVATPGTTVEATWEGPGSTGTFDANGRASLPVKVRIVVDGTTIVPPAAPRLVLERLVDCSSTTVVETVDGGALDWNGDRWRTNIRTGSLSDGCWRVSVAVGDAVGGSFLMTVGHGYAEPSPAAKGTGKSRP